MQRTLIELGFLPVAYLPALVFHDVERLDVVKMVRLLNPPQVRPDGLTPSCGAMAELVLRLFRNRTVLPRIAEAVHDLPLFAGLTAEQVTRLAGVCGVATVEPRDLVFREGDAGDRMLVVLRGEDTGSTTRRIAPTRTRTCRGGATPTAGGRTSRRTGPADTSPNSKTATFLVPDPSTAVALQDGGGVAARTCAEAAPGCDESAQRAFTLGAGSSRRRGRSLMNSP
jgi:hypothetical protein